MGVDSKTLWCLQRLRNVIGKPFVITSAFRTWDCHARIYAEYGKEPIKNSLHLSARAFDIACDDSLRGEIIWLAKTYGFTRIGNGFSRGMIHLDNGTPEEGYSGDYWEY